MTNTIQIEVKRKLYLNSTLSYLLKKQRSIQRTVELLDFWTEEILKAGKNIDVSD